jgi:GT2 family glycosyltransferase
MSLSVSVILPTHNRLTDLRQTLGELAKLDPQPDEVLITADGCTDGTEAFVRTEYPQHVLHVNPVSQGSTASRDSMARVATGDLLLSLDDDSHPLETDAIARLRRIFEDRPRLAVASFPQRTDEFPETLTQTDFGASHFVGTYVNCACAFRRAVLVELGGHFGPFWNAYDEPDFAVRCVTEGWEVRFEPAVTIRHHYSGANRSRPYTTFVLRLCVRTRIAEGAASFHAG